MPSLLPTPHLHFVYYLPPNEPKWRNSLVFTAGSFEMGKALQWQKQVAVLLPITINNSRRGHWDKRIKHLSREPQLVKYNGHPQLPPLLTYVNALKTLPKDSAIAALSCSSSECFRKDVYGQASAQQTQ